MADEPSLISIETLMNELMASNEEMAVNVNSLADADSKKENVDNNVVAEPKINSSLTGDEKARYAAIGKEMFAPILSALEKMIREEKKRNDMTITNGGDEETAAQNINIQYEAHPQDDEGKATWMDYLMEILGIVMIGALLFGPKIEEFFSGAWEWIKELFSSIASFFDFSNGPIAGILNICTGALTGLWTLVKGVFKGLAAVGSWIWNGIKTIFDTFITGPNGILQFGVKIVKGIVDFAKNAINWLGDVIMDAILWPIKAIFGGAEEDGKKAGEEAAEDTVVTANQAVAQQQVAAQAVTDRAIMSQQGAEEEWSKCVANSRARAKKEADKIGLKTNEDGTVTDDQVKTALAEQMIKAIEAETDSEMSDFERKEMIAAMKKEMTVKDGVAKLEGEKAKKAFKDAADRIASQNSKKFRTDSAAINALQEMEGNTVKSLTGAFNGAATKLLNIQGEANVKDEYNAKSEEEKFLWRMEEAKKRGQLAEFRIAEARKFITESTQTIKSTFSNYDKILVENFVTAFDSFSRTVAESIKINIVPFAIHDRSSDYTNIAPQITNNTNHNIIPIDKEDFALTSNQLVNYAQESTDIIRNQNTVLSEIKQILAAKPTTPPPAEKKIEELEASKYNVNNQTADEPDYGDILSDKIESLANAAASIRDRLWGAATSWFD